MLEQLTSGISKGRSVAHDKIAPPPAVLQTRQRVLVIQNARYPGHGRVALILVARPGILGAGVDDAGLVRAEGLLALGAAGAVERRRRVEVAVPEPRHEPAARHICRQSRQAALGDVWRGDLGREELAGQRRTRSDDDAPNQGFEEHHNGL